MVVRNSPPAEPRDSNARRTSLRAASPIEYRGSRDQRQGLTNPQDGDTFRETDRRPNLVWTWWDREWEIQDIPSNDVLLMELISVMQDTLDFHREQREDEL